MASSSRKVLSVDLMNSFKDAVRQKDETRINELITQENAQGKDAAFDTFLHIVAKEGTVETAIRLLELGADIGAINFHYKCPIFCAMENSTRMVEILLKNYEYSTEFLICRALLHASEEETVRLLVNRNLSIFQNTISSGNSGEIQNTEELIRLLLNSEYCERCNDDKYQRLIFFAARIERRDILQLIVDHGKDNLNIRDTTPPLHYAVSLQCSAAVRWLLEEGADPNCRAGKIGTTPLHIAAFRGNKEICKLLLNFGANLNLAGVESPLYYVCGTDEIIPSTWNFFNKLCWRSDSFRFKRNITFNTKIMELLLENGADPNNTNHSSKVLPLHKACKAGRMTDVKMLLNFGANIQALDNNLNSALHYAVEGYDSFEMVAFLVEKGLDIEMKNNEGYTPLMLAALKKGYVNLELLDYLVDHGAQINVRDKNDITFFHKAVYYGAPSVVEFLLELGVDWMIELEIFPFFWSSKNNLKLLISFVALKGYKMDNFDKSHAEDNTKMPAFIYFNDSISEVEKLKSTIIFEGLSITYFDFLNRNLYSSAKLLKNPDLIGIILRKDGLEEKFPFYTFWLNKRIQRIMSLRNSIDRAFNFFLNYGKVQLPILIIEMILGYLCSKDFRIFDKALS